MESVASDMGIFEGHPGRLVLTHNIDLLKCAHYKLAGQFIAWSISNGGPGIACLSAHTYSGLLGQGITQPQDAVHDVADDTIQEVVQEVGRHFVVCTYAAILLHFYSDASILSSPLFPLHPLS